MPVAISKDVLLSLIQRPSIFWNEGALDEVWIIRIQRIIRAHMDVHARLTIGTLYSCSLNIERPRE